MLETLLGSKTRARILSALYLDGGRFGLLELQRLVGTSISSVQAELVRLEALGLARSERTATGRHIEGVGEHPLAGPLRALLVADRDLAARSSAQPASAAADAGARLNPVVRPHADAIADACKRHGAVRASLVGSATQPDTSVVPADLDVLVRFAPEPEGYAERYFGLLEELERIMGMPVEIIDDGALANPYLREEFSATEVVVYEAA